LGDASQDDQIEPRIEPWVDQTLSELHELLSSPLPAAYIWAAGRSYRTDYPNRYHSMTL
jgi:hypothetical protein